MNNFREEQKTFVSIRIADIKEKINSSIRDSELREILESLLDLIEEKD